MPAETIISSDDEQDTRSRTCRSTRNTLALAAAAGANASRRKRPRTDSSSSPLAPELRIEITRRQSTPFAPSTPRDTTPSEPDNASSRASSRASSVAGNSVTSVTVKRNRNSAKEKRKIASDADPHGELAASIKRDQKSKSDAYHYFEQPILQPVANGEKHSNYLFKCKACGDLIKRSIGESGTSPLLSHIHACRGIREGEPLHLFGFTGGSQLTKQQVRETCALWVSQHARPYSIVEDHHLPEILHPDARKHKPSRKTVSADIKRMYHATQLHIITVLAALIGTLHIGLDLFQSASGYDFLGIVLFHTLVQDGGSVIINRFVLECLSFNTSHTGKSLAASLLYVLDKFEIRDRVWGIVCDNASNNAAMIDELKKKRLKRMNGAFSRVFCILHVLNLVAQGALRPFRTKGQQLEAGDDHETEFEAPDLPEDFDIDKHDNEMAELQTLHCDDDDESIFDEADLVVPETLPGSKEETIFNRAKKVLFKIAKLAHKLRYSPAAKAAFKAVCVKLEMILPHNIRRDMKIRWNSTEFMLEDAYRLFKAILDFQSTTRFMPDTQLLSAEDEAVIEHLLLILKPLRQVSEILSRAGVAMLADVIPHMDGLMDAYDKLRSDHGLPLYIRQSADRARAVLNKYYSRTDDSELYRIAMLLHPSLRVTYLKRVGWEPEWVEVAVEITVQCWKDHYQSGGGGVPRTAAKPSQFAYSTFLSNVFANLPEQALSSNETPVHKFVYGASTLETDSNGMPGPISNPLQWWHAQRVAGNEWDGLTQMALDVLSIPASSVDVERMFSFAGSIVSKRRHNLAPLSIQATASLGSYLKAGLVQRGCLVLPQKGKAAE